MNIGGTNRILYKKLTAAGLAFLLITAPLGSVVSAQAASLTRDTGTSASTETRAETPSPRGEAQAQAPVEQPAGSGVELKAASGDSANLESENSIQPLGAGDSAPTFASENRNEKQKHVLAQTDLSSGALTYAYDIAIPPGRNGMTPDVSLSYNSQNIGSESLFGSGWSLSIPYIERLNKTGTNKLYAENYYTSSLDGELVFMGGNTYRAKTDGGEFRMYTFSSGVWTVTDKKGNTYSFGASAQSRQDDPANTIRTYKWMLERTTDANGNFIRYEYWKDQGQIYPAKIFYTGYGASSGIFAVELKRAIRSDVTTNYGANFPVTTGYRINQIVVTVSGVTAATYDIGYTTADNGTTSLVASIQETGQNGGAVTVKPKTEFTYSGSNRSWVQQLSGYALPDDVFFTKYYNGSDAGGRLADVNGDGLTDLLVADHDQSLQRTYLNTGTGWNVSSVWTLPVNVWFKKGNEPNRTEVADINGDALADIVVSAENDQRVYLNDGVNGWVLQAGSWQLPAIYFARVNGLPGGGRLADINGDGLPDLVIAEEMSNGVHDWRTYLNTGTGWMLSVWTFPTDLFFSKYYNGSDKGGRLVDINSDGLPDVIVSVTGSSGVYLNTGTGWAVDPNWNVPADIVFTRYYDGSDAGGRVTDINGDGRADLFKIVKENDGSLSKAAYVNNGKNGWVPSATALPDVFFSTYYTGWDQGARNVDINGDSLDDILVSLEMYAADGSSMHDQRVFVHNGARADVLTRITTPQGWTIDVAYTPSSSAQLVNPKLPLNIQTVEKITTADPVTGLVSTDMYAYAGGKYFFQDALTRRFAGFASVEKTDALGNKTTTYFHQGDQSNTALGEYNDSFAKIGRAYRTEVRDMSGNLYTVSVTKWDAQGNFVLPVKSTALAYDGLATHKDTASSYAYDTSGNLTQKIEYGDVIAGTDGSFVDIGSDKRTTATSYAKKAGAVTAYPAADTVTDAAGATVAQTRHYYDNLALGIVTKGNETKKETWDGAAYVSEQKAYTAEGLVASSTDPRGKVTTYFFDTPRLYSTTVKNPLLHAVAYLYDYATGKQKQVTDQNGYTKRYTYDGLGRITMEEIPDQSTAFVTKAAYVYTDTPNAVSVRKTEYLDGGTARNTYQYFDGLGRLIQERTEGENGYVVKDIAYDQLGKMRHESLPYFLPGSAKTAPNFAVANTYTYDPLGRPLSITNPLGTTTYTYGNRTATVTDPNAKQKKFEHDAYGNLVSVTEYLAGAPYVTTYAWNPLGGLIKITDALGNVRNLTYDALGRRTMAEDLHAPADTTFGVYTYAYDPAGNLTAETTPNGTTVARVYDDLNRVTKESGTSSDDILYTYDTCTNGKGYLCSSSVYFAAITKYTYDRNANIASEIVTVNGKNFGTSYVYDRQGNVAKITTPDLAEIRYTFSPAGIDKIDRKETTTYIPVVTNVDYHPSGAVEKIAYANGALLTNTFDPMHRLTKKTTTSGAVKLQDISYTYDPVGNITKVVDASATNAGKTAVYTYDDLSRLTSATVTGTANSQNYSETYTYDALGNLLTKNGVAYTYAGNTGTNYANPHAATKIGPATIAYDKNGNMLSDGTLASTWNYKNQLANSVVGGNILQYFYDASGQRARTLFGTHNTYYPNRFYTTNDNNITKIKHIYLDDLLVATIENGVPYYIATDHLGGTNIATNQTGVLTELLDYYPYGGIRLDEKVGTFNEEKKFTGHYYDQATALSYMNARYYEGTTGRFISQDPVFLAIGDNGRVSSHANRSLESLLMDPQMLNSYSYARNNPIRYTDPDGKIAVVDDLAGFAIGGIIGFTIQVGTSLLVDHQLPTGGEMAGAFVTGGVVGWAAVNAPTTAGASVAIGSAVLAGGVGGLLGNGVKQTVDIASGAQDSFSGKELVTNTAISAGTAGLARGVVPQARIPGLSAGRGNMDAVGRALQTKMAAGVVTNMSMNTALKSAVGNQSSGLYRTGTEGVLNGIWQGVTNISNYSVGSQKK